MKTKKLLLFTFMLAFPIICNSQTTDSLVIKHDSLCIKVMGKNSNSFCSLLYEINNISKETYYLWIDEDKYSTKRERIRDYFMRNKLKDKHSMSLYQMEMETNVLYGGFSIYDTFLKRIKPQEKFTIQIFSGETILENKKKQFFKYLDDHVVIVSENTLKQYIVGLDNFNPKIFYNKDFITIPLKLLTLR